MSDQGDRSVRARLSLCVGFAALLALAGCAQEAVNKIQYLRPGVALPAAQYTPAKDAILVVNGGFGASKPAGPLVTRWQRKSTGETFFLTLTPDVADVQALVPGTYEVVSATGLNQEVIGAEGDHEIRPSRVSAVTLRAGDVVYAGRLMVAPQKPDKQATGILRSKWRLEVGNDRTIALAGLQQKYPGQAGRLRVDLVKLTQK